MLYKEWLNEWLNHYIKTSTKMRTFTRYTELTKLHIIPYLGDIDIIKISPITCQKYISFLLSSGNLKTKEGLSSNMVNIIITIIQSSLNTAYSLGIINQYNFDKIKRPKIKEKQIECFTLIEQKKIEEAVLKDKRIKMIGILLCLYTGLRIGELLALEWSDVDFKTGIIAVSKNCFDGKDEEGKYCRIIDTPKTITSKREIPIAKQLVPLLKNIKKISKSQFIVSNGEKEISIRSYQKSFELLLKKIKLPPRGFHSLRHTFATRALECGMDVKTLSEILGHKNPNVTLNRYAHSLLSHKKEMMNKLGNYYDKKFTE